MNKVNSTANRNKKINVGVIYNNDEVHAWLYKMLSEIKSSGRSEIVVLIKNRKTEKSFENTHYIYNLYNKLDRKFFKVNPDALEKKSLKSILDIVTIDDQDIERIRTYNIDILIQIGVSSVSNQILNLAKYGIWSFCFENSRNCNHSPQTFWEVIKKRSEIVFRLMMLTESNNKVLATYTTLPDNLSITKCKNNCFWKAASILPRKIDELNRLGELDFFKKVNESLNSANFSSYEIQKVPSNSKALYDIVKFKWVRILKILKSFKYFDQWILLFNIEGSTLFSTDFSKFKKIIPPKDRFWADPHVIKKNDRYYIFIEELIYTENKGFISVIEMDNLGNYKDSVKVLETDYHLSFPFIIEDQGEIYMIPESKQNNNIYLYKCVDFPYKWELEIILMENVKAVDTVVIFKNKKYWLFTNMVENEGSSYYDDLYLFSSDTLVSNKWKPHPENPIVSDVKNARMAGKLFVLNDNIYRPSQNCSNHYGYGMQINKVIELNETSYIEETICSINPDWDKNIRSTHSITNVDNLTVIDAQYKRKK